MTLPDPPIIPKEVRTSCAIQDQSLKMRGKDWNDLDTIALGQYTAIACMLVSQGRGASVCVVGSKSPL